MRTMTLKMSITGIPSLRRNPIDYAAGNSTGRDMRLIRAERLGLIRRGVRLHRTLPGPNCGATRLQSQNTGSNT